MKFLCIYQFLRFVASGIPATLAIEMVFYSLINIIRRTNIVTSVITKEYVDKPHKSYVFSPFDKLRTSLFGFCPSTIARDCEKLLSQFFLLDKWNDFRSANWLDILEFPETTLKSTQQLLAVA